MSEEQAVSDIQQRIATVLRSHEGTMYDSDITCCCGASLKYGPGNVAPWGDHVAAAVVSELGLTQERAFRYMHNASGLSTIIESTSPHVHVARKIAGDIHTLTEVSRYVTEWMPE